MSHRTVLETLGPPAKLGPELGLRPKAIAIWRFRQRIPARYWLDVARCAERRGLTWITIDLLRYTARPERRESSGGRSEAA